MQVNTIQRNIDEGKITALEALVLYKRTRRDGRIESKRVNLANDPVVRRPTEVSPSSFLGREYFRLGCSSVSVGPCQPPLFWDLWSPVCTASLGEALVEFMYGAGM